MRRDRGGALPLATLGAVIGIIAILFAYIDAHTRTRPLPGPVWQTFTVCACVAALGAIAAFALDPARLRPTAMVGAFLALVTLVGVPAEVIAVRPHIVRAQLVAFDAATGARRWSSRLPLVSVDRLSGGGPDLVAEGENARGRCDQRTSDVHVDPSSGRPLSADDVLPVPDRAVPVASDHGLTFTATGRDIIATDESGTTKWTTSVAPGPSPQAVVADGVVVLVDGFLLPRPPITAGSAIAFPPGKGGATLVGLDERTGQQAWSVPLAESAGIAAVGRDVFVLDAGGGLERRDVHTGQSHGRTNVGFSPEFDLAPPLWGVGQHLVTVASDHSAVGLDLSGHRAWRQQLPGSPYTAGRVSYGAVAGTAVAIAIQGRLGTWCGSGD